MSKFLAQLLALILFVFFAQAANTQGQPAQAPASTAGDQPLKPEQIDALVSPIALYPDTLLAEVLMASTYPLEVVQAARWMEQNKNLKGDALKAEVDKQGWDESIKSLTATPDALKMMSAQLDWTQKLGDAVLAQQADVMDSVQRLRAKADANNKLQSTKEQKVTKKSEGGKQYIVIEPTDPQTVYVPSYNPQVVYGAWPYPAYPPYYWATPYPGYIAGAAIATGLAFGAGYAVGRWASGGNYWGGGVNWGNNNINVNRPVNINTGGNNWNHNVDHRHGVRYNNNDVANKFNKGNNVRGSAQNRMDFRGHDGKQALRPGGDGRPGGGDRPGAGDRPGGGDRAGAKGGGDRAGAKGGRQRQDAGSRGSGQQKAAAQRGGGGRPGGGGGNAFAGSSGGRDAMAQASRGHASLGGGGGGPRMGGGGGGARMGAGGGGGRGGGGGGGGGRRSDIALKHDITLLGHLDNGLGFYRFVYNGGDKAYVGVMAQEVQTVRPDTVVRGRDGYLRVFYDRLGVKFETYDRWIASGARIPSASSGTH